MKKLKQTNIIVILIILTSFLGYNVQGQEVVGTWVAEGSAFEERWVFTNDNTLKEYSDGVIDVTYNWIIISSINSGVVSHYLEIINVNDSTDIYKYEINILSDERLTLVYQRGVNMGIGKLIILFRQ